MVQKARIFCKGGVWEKYFSSIFKKAYIFLIALLLKARIFCKDGDWQFLFIATKKDIYIFSLLFYKKREGARVGVEKNIFHNFLKNVYIFLIALLLKAGIFWKDGDWQFFFIAFKKGVYIFYCSLTKSDKVQGWGLWRIFFMFFFKKHIHFSMLTYEYIILNYDIKDAEKFEISFFSFLRQVCL